MQKRCSAMIRLHKYGDGQDGIEQLPLNMKMVEVVLEVLLTKFEVG